MMQRDLCMLMGVQWIRGLVCPGIGKGTFGLLQ